MTVSLKSQIQDQIKDSMRAKDTETLSVMRMLMASIKNLEIDKKLDDLSDEDIIEIIQRQVKQRREAIVLYQKGGRSDLADKESSEIAILNKYLPQQLGSEELAGIVDQVVLKLSDEDKNNFGLVMKKVMEQVRGRADGSLVAGLVKQKIG